MTLRLLPTILLACAALVGAVTALQPSAAGEDEAESAPVREGPRVVDVREAGIGHLVPDVSFTDVDGRTVRLRSLQGSGVVILARSTTCPVSKRQRPTQARLAAKAGSAGFHVIVLNVAEHDSEDDVRGDRESGEFGSSWVRGAGGDLIRALGVRSTTEAFVLDGAHTLVYRGAVDDQYGLGYALPEARRSFVDEALDAVLARRRPEIEATSSPGCVLDVKPLPQTVAPTYHANVSRILDRNCVECHRDGQSAPFALDTYELAKGNRAMIRLMVERRLMPPWFADPAHSLPMGNDRSLAEQDRAALIAWADAGGPEGDAADAPRPLARADGWTIGEPDVVLELPEGIDVPAEGRVPYRYVVIATDFAEDRWVSAFEIRPSEPEVVHHVLVFAHYPGSHPRMMEQPQERNGVDGYFAAMVPGQNHLVFPSGTGRFLPKGTRLRFQIHYTPNGRAVVDRPQLALRFTKGKPEAEVSSDGVHQTRFRIPPGAAAHPVEAKYRFERRGRVLSLTPHMHLRGSAFRYQLEYPDGRRVELLDVPRYDFNWQLNYRLQEPLDVPAGTVVHARALFDNSAANLANPDPTKTVRFGEQTDDEMMIGYIEWVPRD